MSDLHTQGAVPLSSNAHVAREFERDVLREILAGNWVLLLGPRQHGKTTGLVRIKKQLVDNSVLCAIVSLEALPPCENYPAVLAWIAKRLATDMQRPNFSPPRKSDTQEFEAWLTQIVPPGNDPLVLIIDEAAGIIRNDWRNAFYGQIRAIANQRAAAEESSIASRLRFIFAGTFRPEKLIDTINSPFNVCDWIETDDLTAVQARELWHAVRGNSDYTLVDQAFSMVGGQPYLLQLLLGKATRPDLTDPNAAFGSALEALRGGENAHFDGIFSKIVTEPSLAKIAAALAQNGRVPNEAASADFRVC